MNQKIHCGLIPRRFVYRWHFEKHRLARSNGRNEQAWVSWKRAPVAPAGREREDRLCQVVSRVISQIVTTVHQGLGWWQDGSASEELGPWAGWLQTAGKCEQRSGRRAGYFPDGASGKEPACQWRGHRWCRFDPCIRKIPWRRKWQPTPVFLLGKFHGQRSLGVTVHGVTKSQTQLGDWACMPMGRGGVTEPQPGLQGNVQRSRK